MILIYYLYLGTVLMPVTPGKIKFKIPNKNKTIGLVSGSEINILKSSGLTEVSFDLIFPAAEYSFARYENGFKVPQYYLEYIEELKKSKKSFAFTLIRTLSAEELLKYSAQLSSLPSFIEKDYDLDGDGRITAADARILLRSNGKSTLLNNTNLNCSIEDYTINEDAEKYGRDVCVSLELKQCPDYSIKRVTYKV